MEIYQAVVLGIIQGLTEFLPVSSSGHLVLTQHLFGLKEPALFFDVSLHVGTLVAVLIVFFQEIKSILMTVIFRGVSIALGKKREETDREKRDLSLVTAIIAGSVPTAIMGLCFREIAHTLFSSTTLVGTMLLITAALLWSIRNRADDIEAPGAITLKRSLVIGFVQGLAVIPGISRSGSTIVAGLYLGLGRKEAARFSFLLCLPAIIGAEILGIRDAMATGVTLDGAVLIGTLVSFVVGYFALKVLLGLVNQGRLHVFAPYCAVVGVVALFLGF